MKRIGKLITGKIEFEVKVENKDLLCIIYLQIFEKYKRTNTFRLA